MSDATAHSQIRSYVASETAVFRKTRERFGGLSNMASGFPLQVNGICIRTSEALYQSCRFPQRPDLQMMTFDQRSPMTAKMKGKPHRAESRPDWDHVRASIMRWCLRVKLAQNWSKFGELLLSTGDKPIVEESRKDDYWAAKRSDSGTLVGINALGRLLMELREELRGLDAARLQRVEPLDIPKFWLLGEPIRPVEVDWPIEDPLQVERSLSSHAVDPDEPTETALDSSQLKLNL